MAVATSFGACCKAHELIQCATRNLQNCACWPRSHGPRQPHKAQSPIGAPDSASIMHVGDIGSLPLLSLGKHIKLRFVLLCIKQAFIFLHNVCICLASLLSQSWQLLKFRPCASYDIAYHAPVHPQMSGSLVLVKSAIYI